jgi:hypothetical protein
MDAELNARLAVPEKQQPRADAGIAVPLTEFLLTEQHCPPEWRPYDLYLCRDDEVVFYVGQSHVAFDRVWQHILDGFKGRSMLGRFILCNWPASLSSGSSSALAGSWAPGPPGSRPPSAPWLRWPQPTSS